MMEGQTPRFALSKIHAQQQELLEERIKGASDELIATSMKFTLLEQNSNDVGMKLSTLPTTPVAPFNVQALYSHPPFAKKSPLKNRQL